MKILEKLRFLPFAVLSVCLLCMVSPTYADSVYYYDDTATETQSENVKTYLDGKLDSTTIDSMVEQYVYVVSNMSAYSKEELQYASDVMSYQTDVYSNFKNFVADNDIGSYKTYESSYNVEETGDDTAEISVTLHFDDEDVVMKLDISCFENIGTQVTATSFSISEDSESMGSKMASAGMNTIIGIAIVFAILLFISLIIYCFRIIPVLTKKFSSKRVETDENLVMPVSKQNEAKVNVKEAPRDDNEELVAVISAAIAASEHAPANGFVVRSIRRR